MARATDADTSRTYFRTARYFAVSNQWYFATREDGDRGPFDTQELAKQALQEYLTERIKVPSSGWEVPGADR